MLRHPLHNAAERGVTLLEISLAMMIVAVLSVGVSNLIRSGVESQMSESLHQHMQVIANSIVDDLRHDLREASNVTIANGGNMLRVQAPSGNITYQLAANGDFSRRSPSGSSKIYNHNGPSKKGANNSTVFLLKVACPGSVTPTGTALSGCFASNTTNMSGEPTQVIIPRLQVEQTVGTGTIIDQNFGPPNYTIRDFSFTLSSAIEFY